MNASWNMALCYAPIAKLVCVTITIFFYKEPPRQLEAQPLKHLLGVYSRFHAESEAHPPLHEEARAWFKKLEEGDPEARRLWEPLETGPSRGLAAIGTADAAIATGRPAEALATLDALDTPDAGAGDAEVPRETIDYARARALLALALVFPVLAAAQWWDHRKPPRQGAGRTHPSRRRPRWS